MTRRKPLTRRSTCPINASLELLGDRWSLLIVRDMIFGGARTFGDFSASQEKIATNVLANRLERLQASGIITSARNPQDGRSLTYSLTEKGVELVPVLMELSRWGTRFEEGEPPNGILDAWQADRQAFLQEVRRSVAGRA
jgi:DNA-binding HxlR family transcriptional regulator